MILDAARIFLFVYGALTIIGGVIGFVKAKSRPSLIAGVGSGVLLLGCGELITGGRTTIGLVAGLVIALALAGRFVPAYRKGGKFMPAGLMALLSIAGILMTIAALIKPTL